MKQNIYEMDSTTVLEDSSDNSFRGLSSKEMKLFQILSKIKGQSQFAFWVRAGLNGSVERFREFIKELNKQYGDVGRERMIELIGVDAVKLLEVL